MSEATASPPKQHQPKPKPKSPFKSPRKPRKGLSDEDALLKFTPLIREQNPEALELHRAYEAGEIDKKEFIRGVKGLLVPKGGKNFKHKQQKQQQPQQQPPNENLNNNNGTPNPNNRSKGKSRRSHRSNKKVANEPVNNKTASVSQVLNQKLGIVADTASSNMNYSSSMTHNNNDSNTPTHSNKGEDDEVAKLIEDVVNQSMEEPSEDDATNKLISENNNDNTTSNTAAKTPKYAYRNPQPVGRIKIESGQKKQMFQNISVLSLGPRAEFLVYWALPLSFERDVKNIGIGLFRLGSGDNTSVVSKSIKNFNKSEDSIWGSIPFFTPRTPGYFILRLFTTSEDINTNNNKNNGGEVKQDDSASIARTLVNSEIISVRCSNASQFTDAARFLLANFKAKKGLSSAPLQNVFVLFATCAKLDPQHSMENANIARMGYGMIAECNKVVVEARENNEDCTEALTALEEEKVDIGNTASADKNEDMPNVDEELEKKLKDARKAKAISDRKLKEINYYYSLILKEAIRSKIFNESTTMNYTQQLERFCPIDDTFIGNNRKPLNVDVILRNSGNKYLKPRLAKLSEELIKMNIQNQKAMDEALVKKRKVVDILVGLINEHMPQFAIQVFGSSINGFGSPESDLDLSLTPSKKTLQKRPQEAAAVNIVPTVEDLEKLAKLVEEHPSFQEVSTRLTARIPILRFEYIDIDAPNDGEALECDISIQNPLALHNTALLRRYSEFTLIKTLSAVVKKYMKSKNLNNPSAHSLSSYGYVLMVINYFVRIGAVPNLQHLKWEGNKFVISEDVPSLLIQHPSAADYQANVYFYQVQHNTEAAEVEAYRNILTQHDAQQSTLSYHLVNFFYYYAYVFDYRRDILSLNNNSSNNASSLSMNNSPSGLSQKEINAERFNWRIQPLLSIEDPFERFYDVAHVLNSVEYQRMRSAFSDAYQQIVLQPDFGRGICSKQEDGLSLIECLCTSDRDNDNKNVVGDKVYV